jgi:hypothetical protein
MWAKSKMALGFLAALGTTAAVWAGPTEAATKSAPAANRTAVAAAAHQHIANKGAGISFDALGGFVHQKIASYYEVSEYNRALGVQILIQNAGGAVSIANGHTFLTNWLGGTDLTFGASKYVHKGFGKVADIAFSNQPSAGQFRLYGRDLRFADGLKSYDVVIDSPNPSAAVRTANLLLSTWGS